MDELKQTGLFVVAIQLQRSDGTKMTTTVRMSIYRAISVDEALGKAILEHVGEGWSLGAGRCQDLASMLPVGFSLC